MKYTEFLRRRRHVKAEQAALDRLARACRDRGEYLANLEHAVTIAQSGGVKPRMLEALLTLGGTRTMTPGTEQILHEVGIDTRPWAEVSGKVATVNLLNDAPMGYALIPPEGRCVSPHGHDQVEDKTLASLIPTAVICPACCRAWTIVVIPLEEDGSPTH